MKTNYIIKKKYLTPNVECILLDNEISLILQSDETPPTYEFVNQNSSELINSHPFNGFA